MTFVWNMDSVSDPASNDLVAEENLFVFSPDKKSEVWRFLMYMFVHVGWVHLLFNLTTQLLVGLPLEMVHGSARLAVIYLSGVLAGSLGASVFDRNAILVGASGGVYALLAAHVANVLLNYQEMQLGILRVLAIISVGESLPLSFLCQSVTLIVQRVRRSDSPFMTGFRRKALLIRSHSSPM